MIFKSLTESFKIEIIKMIMKSLTERFKLEIIKMIVKSLTERFKLDSGSILPGLNIAIKSMKKKEKSLHRSTL